MPGEGGGLPIHRKAIDAPYVHGNLETTTWVVLRLTITSHGNISGLSYPLAHIYAAVNVGIEGWCVLTADQHTLVHVLRDRFMSTRNLPFAKRCRVGCGERSGVLVPRLQEGSRKTLNKYRLTFFSYLTQMDESLWHLQNRISVLMKQDFLQTPIGAETNSDPWNYLQMLAPFFSKLETFSESWVNKFLRNFTHVNPITWQEARDIVFGNASLRRESFYKVRHLPQSYLEQHAPAKVRQAVSLTRCTFWPLQ